MLLVPHAPSERVTVLSQQAQLLFDSKDLKKAINKWRECEKLLTQGVERSVVVDLQRSDLLSKQSKAFERLRDFENALETMGESMELFISASGVDGNEFPQYLKEMSRLLNQLGRVEEAQEYKDRHAAAKSRQFSSI